MLTASHNPKEYNGYKAYGKDGGQLVSPHDKAVMGEVLKLRDIKEVIVPAPAINGNANGTMEALVGISSL